MKINIKWGFRNWVKSAAQRFHLKKMLYELSPVSKESFEKSFVTLDSKAENEISDK